MRQHVITLTLAVVMSASAGFASAGDDREQNRSGNKDHALYMEGTNQLIANNVIYDHPYGHAVQIYPNARGTIITNNTIVNTSYTAGYRAAGIIDSALYGHT